MSVEVVFQAGDWPDDAQHWANEAEAALLAELGRSDDAELAILLTDDAEIQKLNAQFRGKDKPTNVLSWPSIEYERALGGVPKPLEDDEGSLGDLAFGYQTCVKEAQSIGLENHFKHLVIHGILHLLGYDHLEQKDAEKMEALEIAALSRLNITNPYEDVRDNEY